MKEIPGAGLGVFMSSLHEWMTEVHWHLSSAVQHSVITGKPHPQEVPLGHQRATQ